MLDFTRRTFLKGMVASTAFAAMGGFKLHAQEAEGTPKLRLGIVSDVHITSIASTKWWEKTLTWFRDHQVDGVIAAGDLADWGLVEQLKNFADTWYKVFPNDKGTDGRHVEKLFVEGNHDHEGFHYVYRGKKDKLDEAYEKSIVKDRKTAWDLCFHEEFQPIFTKQVKGYTFIGAHWPDFNNILPYMEAMKGKIDPSQPFFYAQHPHPQDTIYGPWAWGHDRGASTKAFSAYPNAIVFTGHSHYPLTDETGIWQDTFTSIGTASLHYIGHRYGRDNSGDPGWPTQMRRLRDSNGKQFMLLSVYDDHITINRRECVTDQSLGDDWVLPLPLLEKKPYAIPTRAKKAAEKLPAFAPQANEQIEVARGVGKDRKGVEAEQISVTFPTALAASRAFDYEVQAELTIYDVRRVFSTRRVFSENYYQPAHMMDKTAKCVFASSELPQNVKLHFVVTPLDCFGNRGQAIVSKDMKLEDIRKPEPQAPKQ